MVVNPTTGAVVTPKTNIPLPSLSDFFCCSGSGIYWARDHGGSLRSADNSIFMWGWKASPQNHVLLKFDENMNLIKHILLPPENMLVTQLPNGIMVNKLINLDQNINYTIYNPDLNPIVSDRPMFPNTSLLHNAGISTRFYAEGDDLYILSLGGTPTSTNVVGKYKIDAAGTITKTWETKMPYPNATYDSHALQTVQGHLAIMATNNAAPFNDLPTGFYHDGTLVMAGAQHPMLLINKSTGAHVKTLFFGSPAYRTNYGTHSTQAANTVTGFYGYVPSPTGHRLLVLEGPQVRAGVNDTTIYDSTTMESTYSLTNDSVERPIGKRFMVFDFNNNINKVELKITEGQLGDVLGIDGAFTLPSGMTKTYSFSQKRLTITGSPNNTSDNFRDALNAIVFSTDAATGSRTLELKVYDADGMVNTTNFTVNVQ